MLAFVVVVVAIVLCAVLVSGAGIIGWKKVRKAKKQYDLAAFDGYVGEEVTDGLERQFRELAFADLSFDKKVGEGAFGKVFLGTWRGLTVIAIKELSVHADEKAKCDFIHEANVMAKIGNHPNVVRFIGAVTTEEKFYMITEFAEFGSLYDVLKKNPFFISSDLLQSWAEEAAAGVAHLHDEGFVHRDIAARNFLVTSHRSILVTDFGLSRVLDHEANEDDAQKTTSNIGPVRWMAPESLSAKKYSKKSDVFMFGRFLFELFTAGEVPFSHVSVADVASMVVKDNAQPELPTTLPVHIIEVMHACWQKNPKSRPSMRRVLAMLRQDSTISPSASHGTVETEVECHSISRVECQSEYLLENDVQGWNEEPCRV